MARFALLEEDSLNPSNVERRHDLPLVAVSDQETGRLWDAVCLARRLCLDLGLGKNAERRRS